MFGPMSPCILRVWTAQNNYIIMKPLIKCCREALGAAGKRVGNSFLAGETEEHFGDIVDEYRFMTEWGSALYSEWQTRDKQGDDALYCWLTIYLTGENGAQEESEADCFILNAIFDSNQKVGSWSARREYENGQNSY